MAFTNSKNSQTPALAPCDLESMPRGIARTCSVRITTASTRLCGSSTNLHGISKGAKFYTAEQRPTWASSSTRRGGRGNPASAYRLTGAKFDRSEACIVGSSREFRNTTVASSSALHLAASTCCHCVLLPERRWPSSRFCGPDRRLATC